MLLHAGPGPSHGLRGLATPAKETAHATSRAHHTRNSDGRRTRDRLHPHSRGLRCASPDPGPPWPSSAAAQRTRRPSCTRWPVGSKRKLSLRGPATVVAAESVQAGGPGPNRNPLPAGHRAHYHDRPFPENLIRDLTRTDRDPAWPLILAQRRAAHLIPSRATHRSPRPWPRRRPGQGPGLHRQGGPSPWWTQRHWKLPRPSGMAVAPENLGRPTKTPLGREHYFFRRGE